MLVSISTAVLVDIGTFATIKISSKRCEDGSSPRGATRIECAAVVDSPRTPSSMDVAAWVVWPSSSRPRSLHSDAGGATAKLGDLHQD